MKSFKKFMVEDTKKEKKEKTWKELKPLPKKPKTITIPIRLPKLSESRTPQLTIKESDIHGMGVFITENITANTPIGLYLQSLQTGHNDYVRTDIARLTNHATNPNVDLQEHSGNLYIVANRDIKEGNEICVNYFEVAKMAQPRNILRDSFVRLYPEIDEEILQDPPDVDFYEDLEYLAQLEEQFSLIDENKAPAKASTKDRLRAYRSGFHTAASDVHDRVANPEYYGDPPVGKPRRDNSAKFARRHAAKAAKNKLKPEIDLHPDIANAFELGSVAGEDSVKNLKPKSAYRALRKSAVLEYLEGYFGGQLNESTSDEDIMGAFYDLLETADAVEEYLDEAYKRTERLGNVAGAAEFLKRRHREGEIKLSPEHRADLRFRHARGLGGRLAKHNTRIKKGKEMEDKLARTDPKRSREYQKGLMGGMSAQIRKYPRPR